VIIKMIISSNMLYQSQFRNGATNPMERR